MPKKFLKRSTRIKRTYHRGGRRGKRINVKNKATGRFTGAIRSRPGYGSVHAPFPPNMFTVFTYSKTFTLNQATTTIPTAYTFRANGLYDPDQTGVGIQPRYYDSLLGDNGSTAPYRNYRVHASKINVTAWPIQADADASNCLLALMPRRSNVTSPSSIDEMRERPYSRFLAMTTTASFKPRSFKNMCKIKYHLGHKDLADVDATAAAYNANPTEEVYWDLIICDVQGDVPAHVAVQVTITYYAQLYTLADVADS